MYDIYLRLNGNSVLYVRKKGYHLPKLHILDSSKLKEFVADNFNLARNGRKFQKGSKTLSESEKLPVKNNFSFVHNVFNRLLLQTRINKGLFRKGLYQIERI